MRVCPSVAAVLLPLLPLCGLAQEFHALAYAPAPIDNPLKGFVPYDGDRHREGFPHSLEWFYLPLAAVMDAPGHFNWQPVEQHLAAIAGRGRQAVFRIYLDYPGSAPGTPRYLLDAGLKTHAYEEQKNQGRSVSPDYEDPRLRAALAEFIAAFGARYDGDPRIGFLTVGMLGFWGEWHDEAHHDWFASKVVQREVMEAYLRAFTKTRLLVRYPAGPDDPVYAENASLPFGYHDDSFAWATMPASPPKKNSWYFLDRMTRARALDQWRAQPIGGEVRPEVWDTLWNDPTGAPAGQEFDRCVDATHATWLMNSGVFHPGLQGENRERALAGARRLGYELFVSDAALDGSKGELRVRVRLHDTGVAPFYYAWPVEIGLLNAEGKLTVTRTDWSLPRVLPGAPAEEFSAALPRSTLPAGTCRVLLRVANPMAGGPPLRFANQAQDEALPGWVTLGSVPL